MTLFSARRLARIDLRSSECFDCNDVFGHGLFQRGVALFAAASAFAVHCHTQAFELIASDVDHWCSQPAGVNMSSDAWKNAAIPLEPDGRFSRCRVYASPGDPNITETVPCLQWDYDPRTAHESLVSRWDLVCHRRPLVGLANAVYSAGALVAMLAAGYAADHVGRKLVIQLSVGILLAATMGIAFADTYVIYVTTRFINSAAVTSVFVISYILLYEVSSHDHRHVHTTVAMGMGLTLSDVWFDVLKQVHIGWRVRQSTMLAPTMLLTSAFFLVEESPRWLIFKQGIKAAEVATLTLAKVNGFSLPTTAAMMVKIKDEMLKNQEALLQRAPCAGRDAFSVQRSVFVMSISYFSVTFAFYTFLKLSVHRSDAWARWGAVALQGMCYALMVAAIKRFTRRQVATAYFLGLGVLGLLTSATLSSADFVPALFVRLSYALTKACAFVALTVNFCYGLELFLTPVRGAAMCWMFACGRAGSVAAYLLSALLDIGLENIELAVMAALAFLSAIILQNLPDVIGHGSLSCTETTRVSVGRDASKLDLEHMKLTLTNSVFLKPKMAEKHEKVRVGPTRSPSVTRSESSRRSKTNVSRTVK